MEEQKRMTAEEQRQLYEFCTALTILKRPELDKRFSMIPYGKRDLAMIRAKVLNSYIKILQTIPLQQLESISRNLDQITYHVGIKTIGANQDKDYGLVVSFDTLNTLVDGCRDTCLMCSKSRTEQLSCVLRKAFDHLPIDKHRHEGSTQCEYMELIT